MLRANTADGEALRAAFEASEAGIPNLTDLSIDPADLDAAEVIFSRLSAYCGHKASAMRYRLAGDIEAALSHERCADAQYRKLPDWARW